MHNLANHLVLAADAAPLRHWEWDTPRSGAVWGLILFLTVAYLAYVVWLYLKDTQMLGVVAKSWLLLLRLGVLFGLLVIAFNPQLKKTKQAYHPSKVGILFDTSLSMRFPAGEEPVDSPGSENRLDKARELVFDQNLIETLQKEHEVSLFTFDSTLEGPLQIYPSQSLLALKNRSDDANNPEDDATNPQSPTDWKEILVPEGTETRLAEATNAALSKLGGHVSGLVIFSDGASNAGLQPSSANAVAREQNARLVAVGLGSTQKPINLSVASIQAPSVVRISDQPDEPNDPFDLIALVQGEGLKGKSAEVELLLRPKDDPNAEPVSLETRSIAFDSEMERIELTFEREPTIEGREEYLVRTRISGSTIGEVNPDDNEARRTVDVTKKKLQILLVAGGPMRDYRFLRSMLSRRAGLEMDIWLQTVDGGIVGAVDQDARELLTSFPETAEELFKYDVIVAFDPDWKMLDAEQVRILTEWVATHAGGMIYVAGDVFTGELSTVMEAAADSEAARLKPLLDLLPVYLSLGGFDVVSTISSDQGWPIEFTKDGEEAGFLQLEDDPGASKLLWKEFPGIYRCFPTAGAKPAATVYGKFADPRFLSQYGQPILLAAQFYGAGRVLYLGSGEIWRIRSISDEYFDRIWIRAIREVAQGRMKQGNQRLMLMPERKTYYLGQTVRIRARAFDRQLEPLDQPEIELKLYEPDGKEVVPSRKLVKDPNREGEYVGDFRVTKQGSYRLELVDPVGDETVESRAVERAEIEVTVPRLESDNIQQNPKLLRELVADTNGAYLTAEEAVAQIPGLLPNVGEEFPVDVSSQPLWDRAWVMYLLIGLLSLEWLTRKVLKLA